MFYWTLWSSQQYQHYNVVNQEQISWNTNYHNNNRNQLNNYPTNTVSHTTFRSIHPVNTFTNPTCPSRYQNRNSYYPTNKPKYNQTNTQPCPINKPNCTETNTQAPQPKIPTTLLDSVHSEQREEEGEEMESTMDPSNYYMLARDNRSYFVHFPNRNGLSIEEVKDICKVYGELSKCNQTGDTFGLCFVNFKNEEGAINCVKGLQNHPKIELRSIKSYENARSGNKDKNNSSNESNRRRDYGSSNKPNNSYENKVNYNQQYRRDSKSSNGSEMSYKSVQDSEPKKSYDQVPIDGNISENDSKPMNNNDNNIQDMNNEFKTKEDCDKSGLEAMPKLTAAPKLDITGSKNVKDVIQSTKNIPKKPVEIIEAQEVIVANIAEDYGAPAILHLLEKHQPISVSPIQVSKPHLIRYCHVYFTNVDHAEAAEREFDQFEFTKDKELIVLRVNTLAALASSA